MLPVLLEVPTTPEAWERFAFHHKVSHDVIRQGIIAKGGPALTQYILYPIEERDFGGFLNRNQQAHIEMTQALGLQSEDLSSLDPKDEEQLQSWIATHFQDHFDVEKTLGVSS